LQIICAHFHRSQRQKTFASKAVSALDPETHFIRSEVWVLLLWRSAMNRFFMDTKAHQSLLSEENLQGIGEALGQGIIDWAGGRLT
jgi:hypothetical protein